MLTKFTPTCKVDCTYFTQLRLQKEKKVILHCTILTFWRCIDDRLRGLGVASGRISRFPIDLCRHPYNTLAVPCECVTSLRRSGFACIVKEQHSLIHTLRLIRKRNEPFLPLPSQPQLVLIYRPWSDGRLSRPWCEVASAEI